MAAREGIQKELKLLFLLSQLAFAANLHIEVVDERGAPVWTRLEVRDSAGKEYRPKVSIHETMNKTRGGKPFYLGSFIVNGSADLEVPEGAYTVIAEHGLEYQRGVRQVNAGSSVRIQLKPWVRMRAKGWWSGDMHVHHSEEDAPGIAQAEDLNFTVLASRGKQDLFKHWPAEAIKKVSDRYWISMRNAEDERRGGSWIFNNLQAPLTLGREGGWFPPGLDYVKQGKAQGVWFDIDMPFWWEVPVMVALGHPDSIDILHNQFMQYGIDQSEYWGRPRDRVEFPGWQGFVDYSMQLYYRYLNLGYRIAPSAGTGTGVMPSPAGYDRVYARIDGPFSIEKWYQAIREGHSFVTNGPMLFVTYKNGVIDVKAEAREPIDRIELIANGKIIAVTKASSARFRIDAQKYSWCAVRCFLKTPDNIRLAHSSPIYLKGKWDARQDRAYFASWLDELIRQTDSKRFENEDQRQTVLAIYRQAREVYQSSNVRDFGAKGDGVAKDTAAIQKAVDAGGVVTFPAGTYLSGTIHLRSSVSIHLEKGATLTMSPDEADFDANERLPYPVFDDEETTYFHHSLLGGENIHDVAIFGEGVIDGNRGKRGGPKPIGLKRCQHLSIHGITIRNAPAYAISLAACDDVNIDGVKIENAFSDGIDPDNCRRVSITNCSIDSRDDAIAVKSSWALGERRSSEDITVSKCHLKTNKNAFKFGSESTGDLRNVRVTDCTMEGKNSAILLESLDGAKIENVTVAKIVSTGSIVPFMIRLGTRLRGNSSPGSVKGVQISNFTATKCSGTASITGIPGRPAEGISLTGIDITVDGGSKGVKKFPGDEDNDKREQFRPLPAYGLYARHVIGLKVNDFRVRWETPDARPALILDDVEAALAELRFCGGDCR